MIDPKRKVSEMNKWIGTLSVFVSSLMLVGVIGGSISALWFRISGLEAQFVKRHEVDIQIAATREIAAERWNSIQRDISLILAMLQDQNKQGGAIMPPPPRE